MELIVFIVCAAITVVCSLLVIAQKNPVASVIFLIMAFVAQAILYIQLSALFVAVLQIIVYTGAILVLFLFVIMLLNLRRDEFGPNKFPVQRWVAWVAGFALAAEIVLIAIRGFSRPAEAVVLSENFGSVERVAVSLFTDYVFPFELTSILLIVAIVGAVVLGKKHGEEE